MPLGLYQLTEEKIEINSIVQACVPNDFAELALTRNYIEKGICPNGTMPLLKTVTALENNKVPLFQAPLFDSHNRPISPFSFLESKIPQGFAFLQGEGIGSFDSRYFGLVALHNLIVVKPIFTF